MFGITVYQIEAGRRVDLALFVRADTAPQMEGEVTRLHKEFPEPLYEVTVGPA